MGLRGRNIYDPARRAQNSENQRESYANQIMRESGEGMRQEMLDDEKNRYGKEGVQPTLISLPKHQYIPDNVPSLDFRRACEVPANTTALNPFLLFEFTCPSGSVTVFTHYGIYCDGLNEDFIEFLPTVDNSRVFPYHGNPSKNFKIGLGLGPDLSNTSLIPANLKLFAGQTLRMSCVNLDPAVAAAMGARFVGYLDSVNSIAAARFGS